MCPYNFISVFDFLKDLHPHILACLKICRVEAIITAIKCKFQNWDAVEYHPSLSLQQFIVSTREVSGDGGEGQIKTTRVKKFVEMKASLLIK